MNSEADQSLDSLRRKMLSPKRLAFQVFGFLLGALLLAYCVKIAFFGDTDWSRIQSASPLMIAALLGTGLPAPFDLVGLRVDGHHARRRRG